MGHPDESHSIATARRRPPDPAGGRSEELKSRRQDSLNR
jgi:hypothetical protein